MNLINGDFLEVAHQIPDNSVDAVICDPPQGKTRLHWDVVIPFEPMWEQIYRVCKENAAIVLFGTEPFSSSLRLSSIHYRNEWIWVKNKATGHLNSKKNADGGSRTNICFL